MTRDQALVGERPPYAREVADLEEIRDSVEMRGGFLLRICRRLRLRDRFFREREALREIRRAEEAPVPSDQDRRERRRAPRPARESDRLPAQGIVALEVAGGEVLERELGRDPRGEPRLVGAQHTARLLEPAQVVCVGGVDEQELPATIAQRRLREQFGASCAYGDVGRVAQRRARRTTPSRAPERFAQIEQELRTSSRGGGRVGRESLERALIVRHRVLVGEPLPGTHRRADGMEHRLVRGPSGKCREEVMCERVGGRIGFRSVEAFEVFANPAMQRRTLGGSKARKEGVADGAVGKGPARWRSGVTHQQAGVDRFVDDGEQPLALELARRLEYPQRDLAADDRRDRQGSPALGRQPLETTENDVTDSGRDLEQRRAGVG